ncbi:hypothetical protein [Polymorphospora rubra]|uniref:Uncharacterized protein n=1 Tax=Polymorphospora rubra TaxID=338584 RepID=A0A810MRW6_9ACTN|nr:hypothetical protein [Polymorphospora rubra]BCJ63957.1 hypothetical protein Prubr_09780 [Polymorphospora rubra]
MTPATPDELVAALLPPALELTTAYVTSDADPSLYWEALHRVVGESLTGAEPGRAVAELLVGLSALAGLLLDQLAEAGDRDRTQVLAELHRTYLTH